MSARADFIAGLRALADALDADASLRMPYQGADVEWLVFTSSREELQSWARVMDGVKRKKVDDSTSYGFQLHGAVGGVKLLVLAHRDEVCRRVVIGTREVTRMVPDQSVEVPMVAVTETVEDIDWICEPLLADAQAVTA